MPNMIELVTKYLPILDAQYKLESRSAILDIASEFVQSTRDAKTVKIAKMTVDGLADYSRNGGFVSGTASLTWEEHTFTQDRGRSIQIDDMDNEETFGMAFGRLAGEFQRMHVIPEIDAYRFAKYYQKAGIKIEDFEVTAGKILTVFDDISEQMDEAEVPDEGRIAFVNPGVYKLIMNDPTLSRSVTAEGTDEKAVNKRIYNYNGYTLVKVPSSRFQTAIELKDGTTGGEEAGGFAPAADATAIAILVVSRDSVIQLAKRRIARVWAPTKEQAAGCDGVNPTADAWKFDYRIYHDAWVLDNKVNGIAGVTISATATTASEDDLGL